MLKLGWLQTVSIAVIGLHVGLAKSLPAQTSDRPNVVLIVADDLGYGELGCYGGTEIPTPHLDALASGGVLFTDGYVTAPFCAASRAAMMTGQYQTRFGFEFNPIGAENAAPGIGLPVHVATIPEAMRDAGYATGLVGKWHLGGTPPFHPGRRGFDEFFGFLHEGHFFVPPPYEGVTTWLRRKALPKKESGRWTSPDGRTIWSTHMGHNEPPYDTDNPVMRMSQPVNEPENLTDAFTREGCGFIDRHADQPFFLCLAYNAVHSPLQGEDEYMQRFAHIDDIHRRIFAAMLSHLDDSVGRVVASLRENQISNNTLVIFISDNGGPTAELTSSNAPLRGGKGQLYEGGIRVPLVMSWPGTLTPSVVSMPVTSMDLMATAVELAGATTRDINGIDVLPQICDDEIQEQTRTFYWRVGDRHALRHGDWKLIRRRGDWELYDLANDIGESKNLADQRSDKVNELSKMWRQWNAEQSEPLWQ